MPVSTPARTLIYDGDCGFCMRWVRLGRRLDWLHKIEWVARLDASVPRRFPQVTPERTQKRMVAVKPDGKVSEGFYAMRELMIRFPLTFLPAILFFIPGAACIGVPAYDWVARNRLRLSGAKCETR